MMSKPPALTGVFVTAEHGLETPGFCYADTLLSRGGAS